MQHGRFVNTHQSPVFKSPPTKHKPRNYCLSAPEHTCAECLSSCDLQENLKREANKGNLDLGKCLLGRCITKTIMQHGRISNQAIKEVKTRQCLCLFEKTASSRATFSITSSTSRNLTTNSQSEQVLWGELLI